MELKRTGIGLNQILTAYNLSDIHDMTMDQFRDAMEIFNKKPDKERATTPPDDIQDGGLPWNDPKR